MMRSFFISSLSDIKSDLQPHEFNELLQIPDGLLWVDFEATLPDNDEPILLDVRRIP